LSGWHRQSGQSRFFFPACPLKSSRCIPGMSWVLRRGVPAHAAAEWTRSSLRLHFAPMGAAKRNRRRDPACRSILDMGHQNW
jgi:hypothetical protein